MKYWVKVLMCRKLVLNDADIGTMAVAWGLEDESRKDLKKFYSNYKRSIQSRLDEALRHWFEGAGSQYHGGRKLTKEDSLFVVGDAAKLRRIFAPIDLLADRMWTNDGGENKWISVFMSRAVNYVSNAAPLVKASNKLSSAKVEEWYTFSISVC
jgi:hypothetical protein